MSPEEVINFNIPTGIPLVYELDDKLKPIRHYYLGDPEVVRRAIEVVAQQGNAK
jgi:2,3-bisphosphoglycerate-dependent phosphoglycerate mutase